MSRSVITALITIVLAIILPYSSYVLAAQPTITPTPTPDRLATPVMPENPTQVDVGRNLYYYNCMPCHGDRGQGLTDEWRMAWEEDHRDCWAKGCHGRREKDEGWPLATVVPAVIGSASTAHFATPHSLYDYLSSTHPPQRPGALQPDEYWALTAFLLSENGRLPEGAALGADLTPTPSPSYPPPAPPAAKDSGRGSEAAGEGSLPTAEPTSAIIAAMDKPRPGTVAAIALVLLVVWVAFWAIKNRLRHR